MHDEHDDSFDKAFEGFGEEEQSTSPPDIEPHEEDKPKTDDTGGDDADQGESKEQKKEEPKEGETPPAEDEKKQETEPKPPAPEEQPKEEPKPLTEDSVRSIINEIRTDERNAGQELENTTKEVLDAYYPDGLSNTLVDTSGRKLETPQDVVEASGGEMTTEEAAQWLMNEQYKLDQDVAKIKEDAQRVAETTLKFKKDSIAVLERYEPIFKAYPEVQRKVWSQYEKLVKADEDKGVILSAPDMQEFYDTVLEPYRLAYEYSQQKPATAPDQSQTPPPVPSAEDRMDESGDGGQSQMNDPDDFAQQVTKELAKGI